MNNERKVRCFILLAFCIFNGTLFSQKSDLRNVHDVLRPASQVSLNGYLAEKLKESLNNRILVQDADRLIEPFKPENRTETRMWQTEFWGKWFTSAVLAYRYHPDPKPTSFRDGISGEGNTVCWGCWPTTILPKIKKCSPAHPVSRIT